MEFDTVEEIKSRYPKMKVRSFCFKQEKWTSCNSALKKSLCINKNAEGFFLFRLNLMFQNAYFASTLAM